MRLLQTKVSICSAFNLVALSEKQQEISGCKSENNDNFRLAVHLIALLFTSLGKFEQIFHIL